MVDSAAFVSNVQAEAVQQLVSVASGTEENSPHGKDGHWLFRLGIPHDDTAVVDQWDGENDRDWLRLLCLFFQDVHFSVGFSLAHRGID